MNSARITYTPRPDTNAQAELDALAAIYSFCLRKHRENRKAVEPAPEPNDRDDAKESNGCIAYPNHNSG
jgi:hypothetical protein